MYKYFKNAKIPVFSICDNWISKEIVIDFNNFLSLKNGCYLIKGFNLDGVYVDTCLMPLFMVKEFLKLGISLECLGYVECHEYIDGNLFVNFIEKVFELLRDDLVNLKKVINSMTGLLNNWKCDENGFITIDEDLVIFLYI